MSRGKPFVIAPIVDMSESERDYAIDLLRKAEALGSQVEANLLGRNALELDLGKLIKEILDKQMCRAIYDLSLGDWASKNFKNADGRPMQDDTAREYAKSWELISPFPLIDHAVRRGDPHRGMFTSRSAATFAIMLAEMCEWEKKEIEAILQEGDAASLDLDKTKKLAKARVEQRLLQTLHERSSNSLREEYHNLKDLQRRGVAGAAQMEWVRLRGKSVEKNVHEKFCAVLAKLVALADEQVDPEKLTLTAQLERVTGFADDTLSAFHEYHAGNKLPLQSLIEVTKPA